MVFVERLLNGDVQRLAVSRQQQAVRVRRQIPRLLDGIGGGIEAQQLAAFTLGDVQLVAFGVELHRQRVADIELFNDFTGMDVQHQGGFGFRVVGDKQAARRAVFREVQQQRRFIPERLPAFFNAVALRIQDQNLSPAIRHVDALGLFRPHQAGDPLARVLDGLFQLQCFCIYHPDHRRIGHAADVEHVVVQQHLTRTVREALFVALGEQQALFHFAIGGADGADPAVQ